MVFLTPNQGGRHRSSVVAHELAHSWTGNLITNKTNAHFWLNEGFTTYAGRRIVEVVQGKERAALNIGIGWRGLMDEMDRFKDNMEFLVANVPGIEDKINLPLWIEDTGIPQDAMEPESTLHRQIVSLAKEFELGKMPREHEVADWHGQEWELYLENLPKSVDPSQLAALDARYRLAESGDYEVKVEFLQLAITSGCKQYFGEVEKTLKQVGRMKYIRSLYTALVQGTKEEEKMVARRIFAEARESYHPNGLLAIGEDYLCAGHHPRRVGP